MSSAACCAKHGHLVFRPEKVFSHRRRVIVSRTAGAFLRAAAKLAAILAPDEKNDGQRARQPTNGKKKILDGARQNGNTSGATATVTAMISKSSGTPIFI
jgi:hypothetical protein